MAHPQKILMLDSSPGSSRKLDAEETIHVPNFSKEISLDSEEDILGKEDAVLEQSTNPRSPTPDANASSQPKITVSPKGILKRKHLPERTQPPPPAEDSPRNSKCCHPLVEKIKHIADKTIHKSEKNPAPKKPLIMRAKFFDEPQEIISLDCSPGSGRRERQKLSGEVLSEKDSFDEVQIPLAGENESEVVNEENNNQTSAMEIPKEFLSEPSPPSRKRKEHIYEDIENEKDEEVPMETDQPALKEEIDTHDIQNDASEKPVEPDAKSGASNDPSLLIDEPIEDEESTSENITKLKTMFDTSMTPERKEDEENEAVVLEADETPECEVTEAVTPNGSPNITITEITDEVLKEEKILEDMLIEEKLNADKSNEEKVNSESQEETLTGSLTGLDKRVHFEASEPTSEIQPVEETPIDENENFWSKISDHEYEPVGKPSDVGLSSDDVSSIASAERRVLRLAGEAGASTADNHGFSAGSERAPSGHAATPGPGTPTTIESRTDCEISTSQVDSSALEDLPLKRENRKRGDETSKFQQRIRNQTGKLRSQAGKLKTKLKTMKKPQFSKPEMPKFEKPSFSMPERPKFNMPERPKFNLPDRPKFNFPDRPKINFPDRPKFKLPERPKINLPDRPKFNFPDRPKFSMPKSKFKFPDRPKINFGTFGKNKENNQEPIPDDLEKSTTESTTGSTKKNHILDFRTYPRFFNRNKKNKADQLATASVERPGTPPPGFATVPRVKRQEMVSSLWAGNSSATSAEEEPRHYGVGSNYSYETDRDFQSKLAQVDKDYQQMQEEYERENLEIQKSVKAKIENAEKWNAMERTNAQKIEHGNSLPYIPPPEELNPEETPHEDDESSAASTGHHRRGVLEEIDPDEFFLRQKGISQDNIEVGKYLSHEIRDAFRSPVNALSQMGELSNTYNQDQDMNDSNFNDPNLDDEYYKYSKEAVNDNDDQLDFEDDLNQNMAENDDGYYTFPPVRPSRARKAKAKALQAKNDMMKDDHQNIEVEPVMIQNVTVNFDSIPAPEMFSENITFKNYEDESNIEPPKRKNVFAYPKESEFLENLNEYENEAEQTREMPAIPKRRKRSIKDLDYSESESMFNGHYEQEDNWAKPMTSADKLNEDEMIIHCEEHMVAKETDDTAPHAPRRTRSRSRGSRATSVADDDRTSRGAESIVLDSHTNLPAADLDFMDDLDDGPGYATVDKGNIVKKIEPPPRPPAPFRRHRSNKSLNNDTQFFTVPRALKESPPPKRPLRNYSTLGPSRPPRKRSTTSLTTSEDFKTHDSSLDVTQYVEIDNDEDPEVSKVLKSGDVISKMKDRPLPAPPRPPRGPKKKKDFQDKMDHNDDAEAITADEFQSIIHTGAQQSHQEEMDHNMIDCFDESEIRLRYQFEMQSNRNISQFETDEEKVQSDGYEQEEVIEIEVSTQTDPLPDDFDYELGMDEPFDDKHDYLPSSMTDTTKEDTEENSIDAEILSRGLQKFRESSRPSSRTSRPKTPSDRPKTPNERPKTPLGRMSPTAILVERRVSSPTRINEHDEVVTEASLTVMPIDDPLIYETENKPVCVTPDPELPPYPTHAEICRAQNIAFLEPTEPIISATRRDLNELTIPRELVQPNVQETDDALCEDEPEPTVSLRQIELQQSLINNNAPNTSHAITRSEDLHQNQEIVQPAVPSSSFLIPNATVENGVLRTDKLQVSDLDVERLNVSELQAHKILVREIEGLSLQVSDVNSKSGHLVVRGLELAPGIVEEILQKFSQLAPPSASPRSSSPNSPSSPASTQTCEPPSSPRPETCQQTQTDIQTESTIAPPTQPLTQQHTLPTENQSILTSDPEVVSVTNDPPERPPLPQMPPMYPLAYYPEYSIPPASFYRLRPPTDRHPGEFSDGEVHPAAPSRRRKHKREPVSSSDDEYRPVSRRVPTRAAEPSVAELSLQLLRACQNSVSRTIRYILSQITSHFGGGEDKKDMQMALVIFLVMIAGLIMLGVGDGRTVHHHHWDFFNPNPTNDK